MLACRWRVGRETDLTRLKFFGVSTTERKGQGRDYEGRLQGKQTHRHRRWAVERQKLCGWEGGPPGVAELSDLEDWRKWWSVSGRLYTKSTISTKDSDSP